MMTHKKPVQNRLAFLHRNVPAYIVWLSLCLILATWEAVVRSGSVNSLYLPSPLSIAETLFEMILSGEIAVNLLASLQRILFGFFIGASAGILVGLLFGFSRLAEAVGNPIVYALYPIPKIALLPLIILWLGIGEVSKVAIIALGVFFPVVINTYAGVKNVDLLFIKVAVSFRTNRLNIIRKVIWPAALPSVFAGLKLAAGSSLLLLVAAEMIAAKEGLGALILHYGDLMMTTNLMAGIVVLSVLGIIFNAIFAFLEKKYIVR